MQEALRTRAEQFLDGGHDVRVASGSVKAVVRVRVPLTSPFFNERDFLRTAS